MLLWLQVMSSLQETDYAMFCAIIEEEKRHLTDGTYRQVIDEDLGRVIANLLSIDPDERMSDEAMAEALQQVAARYRSAGDS